jgi:hypothetical protein
MVTLATSYPFLNILWTILIFMALVIWIWMGYLIAYSAGIVERRA